MTAPMNAPRSIRWPLTVHPMPLPVDPPPAMALTRGVMTLSVKALISVLKASATTSPTAMTTNSPCMRKFLKPLSTCRLPFVGSSPPGEPDGPAATYVAVTDESYDGTRSVAGSEGGTYCNQLVVGRATGEQRVKVKSCARPPVAGSEPPPPSEEVPPPRPAWRGGGAR